MTRSPGHPLHLANGELWLHRSKRDPYAAVLCGFDDDPHPSYEEVRAHGPLWRSRLGTWVTSDHGVGGRLLARPGVRVSLVDERLWADPGWRERAEEPWDGHRAMVERICATVLDELPEEFDLAADVAERVPVAVFAEMFGVAPSRLAGGVVAASLALDSVLSPQRPDGIQRMVDAIDDLCTLFAGTSMPEGRPPAESVFLAVVGARIAANLIAGAVLASLEDGRWWAALAEDPRLAGLVVEETLRHDPPLHVATGTASEDLEVAGARIDAGDRVAVLIGGANRDPKVFADPGDFVPGRRGERGPFALTPVLPLGVMALARLQAGAALPAMAARFPRLSRRGPVLRRRRAPVTRSLLRCPVTTGARDPGRCG
ncbi:cytochrome P450 [Actinomadura sp. KC345]|uniref:cytochrome P450 family protein n=1 Tax=Actinomadura sp. KC345 TaxID=2530371 RepID=UPI001053A234|nr:cytochrome P450 [Actinomadura sp. KC345]TDC41953.1 cytochrome P450 [Actinomadura sp. KC345]